MLYNIVYSYVAISYIILCIIVCQLARYIAMYFCCSTGKDISGDDPCSCIITTDDITS